MKINQSLLNRLALKRAGKYVSPFRKGGMFNGTPHASGGCTLRWSENPDSFSELKGRADEIIWLKHFGWYVDAYQHETQFGLVREVKTKNGPRYLACISDPWNGGKDGSGPCRIECRDNGLPYWYECREDAARNADNAAESSAEEMREWSEQADERQQSEEKADEARKEIAGLRTKARSLVEGIRQSTLAPSLCTHLREELKRIREESADAWATLRESMKTMERLNEFA